MKPNFVKQIDKRYRNLNYHGMTMGGGGCGVMTCYNIISVLTRPHLTVRAIWKFMTKKGYVIPGRGTTWDGITNTLKHYGIKNFKVNVHHICLGLLRSVLSYLVVFRIDEHPVAFVTIEVLL